MKLGYWFIGALILMVPSSIAAQSLTDGLVYLYNFSGSPVDSSGNQLNGIVNGATLTIDRFGNPNAAYFFDGVDDNIEIPYSALMRIDPPVSFSFFVKAETLAGSSLKFFKTDYNEFDYNGYWMDGSGNGQGQIQLHFGGGLGTNSPGNRRSKFSDSTITAGVWYHVAGVIRDYNDMDIYIDCQDAGGYYSGSGPVVVSHTSSYARLGEAPISSSYPARFLHGTIDQLAMWNRALNQGEINKICDNHLEPLITSIHGHERYKTEAYFDSRSEKIVVRIPRTMGKMLEVRLYSSDGKICSVQHITSNEEKTISASGLSTGLYVLVVTTGGQSESLQIPIIR